MGLGFFLAIRPWTSLILTRSIRGYPNIQEYAQVPAVATRVVRPLTCAVRIVTP